MKNLSKLGKRGLALVLALVLLVGMVPLGASALTGTLTINVRVFDGSNVYSIGTDTVDCGNPELIQSVTYQIPYLSRFLKSTEYGRVSKVVGNWYFPSGDTQQGANVEWGTNSRTLTMTYWVDWYRPNSGSGEGSDQDNTETVGGGSKTPWTQKIIYHSNYPNGTDYEYTVTYTIKPYAAGIVNGNLKTLSDCGFSVPDKYKAKDRVWNTQQNGQGTSYNGGGNFAFNPNNKNDLHLYAQYVPNGEQKTPVTLTYNGNGHKSGTAPDEQSAFAGDTVFVANEGTLKRDGYTFLGWSTDRNATEPDNKYAPGNEVTLTKNETLYAVWQKQSQPTTVDYTVQWYDIEGEKLKEPDTRRGVVGATVEPTSEDKEIPGYTFDEGNEGNILETVLAADSTKNVLRLYFEKNAETPNISISKIPDATAYTAGADVSWNITVANNGTSAVSGLSIVDELAKDSEPFTGVAITSPDGFSGTPDNFTLEAGQSVTFKAIVAEAEAGTYVNTATVEKDGEPLDEATSVEVVVTEETEPAAPAITVRKEADKTAAKAGETVTYTITVENTGDAPATDVTVTDVLDSNLTFVSYQLGEETVNTQPEGGVYIIGTLEANDVATLVIQATVNADVEAGTIIVNTATADYDGKPDEENPTDHAEVNVIQPDPVDPDPDPTDPGPGPVDPPTPPTPIVTPEPVATPTPSAEPTAEPTDDPGVDIPDPTQPPLGPGPSDDPGTDIPDEEPPMGDNPILNLVDHYHYLVGYPDGSIRPGANITRAEVAEVFYRLMTADARVANWATGNSYSDVTGTAWYTDAINVMSKAGIVNGYEDGTARPNRAITRAEFAMIASQFLADYVEDPGTTTFTDIQGHWAESAIRKVQSIGWVNGDAGTTNFRPNDKITRAEAAVIFNNMLERTPDAEHLDGAMKVWPDNDPGAWYYAAMQEATNSHYYTGNEETESEEWAEVFEHDWVALKAYWKANAGQSPEE